MNPLLPAIIAVLRSHVGRDQAITARDIALEIGLSIPNGDRLVRSLLTDALIDGTLEDQEIPLCAVPGGGYFLAADMDEAQAYLNFLISLLVEALRKVRAVVRLFSSLGLKLIVQKISGIKL